MMWLTVYCIDLFGTISISHSEQIFNFVAQNSVGNTVKYSILNSMNDIIDIKSLI